MRKSTPPNAAEAISAADCDLERLESALSIISNRLHEDEIPSDPGNRTTHLFETWHLLDISRSFLSGIREQIAVAEDMMPAQPVGEVRRGA